MNPYITPEFISGINSGLMNGVSNFTRAYTAGKDRQQREALAAEERQFRKEEREYQRGIDTENRTWRQGRADVEDKRSAAEMSLREREIAAREAGVANENAWKGREFASKNPYLAGRDEVREPDIPGAPARMRPAPLDPGMMDGMGDAPTQEFVPEQAPQPGKVITPGQPAAPFIPQDMVPGLRAYNAQQATQQQFENNLAEKKAAASAANAKGAGQQLRDRDREWALKVISDPQAQYVAKDAYALAQRILAEDGTLPAAPQGPGASATGGGGALDNSLLRAFARQTQPIGP